MTDILFEYDHILIRSEYRTPDIHKHLASHMVFGIRGELTCVVNDDKFKCRGAFIASDVEHTIYAETGDLLLFLLDTTSDMAKCIEENNLQGKDYALINEDTVNRMTGIWSDAKDDLKEADRRLLEASGVIAGNATVTDERIKKVLSFLEGCSTIPENVMDLLCSEACLSESRLSHLFKGQMGIGPSGSGKSTLLNMIGGLDRVDSGTITVDGMEITSLNKKQLTDYRREKLGMVFQAYNLIPELNVIENVRVVKDIAKEPLDETELLQVLGLEKHMTHFPSELSGGQQQRCSIARALVKNPALLLCDELTGALDSASTRDVLKVLQAINERYNTTIIMITHDERISGMADRLVRIRDGKVVENTVKTKLKAEELGI